MSEEYTVATEEELEYEATIARLRAQNRDLLAALENLAEAVEDVNNLTGLDHAYNAARAAIAAAKETK